MRRTWWHMAFERDGDGRDVFVHGGRARKAMHRAAARVGPGWRLVWGPVRMPRMDIDIGRPIVVDPGA